MRYLLSLAFLILTVPIAACAQDIAMVSNGDEMARKRKKPRPPLCSVVPVVNVTPDSVSILQSGASRTLQAHAQENCVPVAGTTWSWVVRNAAVATISDPTKSSVTVTPVATGVTYIVATGSGDTDSAKVTVVPTTGVTCLPGTVTVTGTRVNQAYITDVDGAKYDATTAIFQRSTSSGATIRLSGDDNCWHGGQVTGLYDPATTSWELYHNVSDWGGLGARSIVEDFRSTNMGDCIGYGPEGDNFTIRRVRCIDMHDDCIESDWMKAGVVRDALFEGCYVFLATRPRSSIASSVTGAANTIVMDSVIVWHKETRTGYGYNGWSVGPLFKFSRDTPSRSPKVRLSNVVFRVDRQANFQGVNLNEQGLVTCVVNCTVVWGQPGPYPHTLPPGWVLTRDLSVYTNAVNAFKARHPHLN